VHDDNRAEPLFITGNQTRDAALGEPRIRAGEIIGWRFWRLSNGFLESVFVSYTWRPGVFERSSSRPQRDHDSRRYENAGYHAFRDIEHAEREEAMYMRGWPCVLGSVAMWGEVIEHQHGWRSEYAAIRSIVKIDGPFDASTKLRLSVELAEKYGCAVSTVL
jgi:hypothetical protein